MEGLDELTAVLVVERELCGNEEAGVAEVILLAVGLSEEVTGAEVEEIRVLNGELNEAVMGRIPGFIFITILATF